MSRSFIPGDGYLVDCTAASIEFLGFMLGGFLAAHVGLVYFDRAGELVSRDVPLFPDSMRQVPRALLCYPKGRGVASSS